MDNMDNIDLENGKILHDGAWLSAQDLADQIQEKMRAGDMKISRLAALLEDLNTAVESSHILETKIILTKEQYEKLTLIGGGNDNKCVRRAVLALIENHDQSQPEVDFAAQDQDLANSGPAPARKGKKTTINCSKCNAPIEIDMEDMPSEIRCHKCNARGVLKTHKNKPAFKDNFLG